MKPIFKNGIILGIKIIAVSFGVITIQPMMMNWVQSWHLSAIGYLIMGIVGVGIACGILYITNEPARLIRQCVTNHINAH